MRLELYREQKRKLTGQGWDREHEEPIVNWVPDGLGKWRWRVVAANGRIMADSGQGYVRRIDCLEGAVKVLGGSVHPTDEAVVVRPGRGEVDGWGSERIEIRDLS